MLLIDSKVYIEIIFTETIILRIINKNKILQKNKNNAKHKNNRLNYTNINKKNNI